MIDCRRCGYMGTRLSPLHPCICAVETGSVDFIGPGGGRMKVDIHRCIQDRYPCRHRVAWSGFSGVANGKQIVQKMRDLNIKIPPHFNYVLADERAQQRQEREELRRIEREEKQREREEKQREREERQMLREMEREAKRQERERRAAEKAAQPKATRKRRAAAEAAGDDDEQPDSD